MMDDSITSALRESPGQLLRSVEGLFFKPSGASILSFDNLVELWVMLGSKSFRFRCNADGETLSVDGGELCPKDLGEYGTLFRADLSRDSRFSVLVGMPLRQVSLVKSHGCKYVIGIVLESELSSLVICNWGDELKVWQRVPESLFADEGIHVAPV